jgi:hypothetical protein
MAANVSFLLRDAPFDRRRVIVEEKPVNLKLET